MIYTGGDLREGEAACLWSVEEEEEEEGAEEGEELVE